jgi:hypothetical protein
MIFYSKESTLTQVAPFILESAGFTVVTTNWFWVTSSGNGIVVIPVYEACGETAWSFALFNKEEETILTMGTITDVWSCASFT